MVGTLIGIPGIEKTTPSFRRKLVEAAERIGIEPDVLATIIGFETITTFSAQSRNAASGCLGLIGFCKTAAAAVAKAAGRPMTGNQALEWLYAMTAEEQLEEVVRYFKLWIPSPRPLTVEQAYLIVFAPAFAFKPLTAVAYASGTPEYNLNRPMDTDQDGRITVGDIASKITSWYNTGLKRPRVPVETLGMASIGSGGGLSMVAFVGIGALVGWYVLGERVEEYV